MKRLSELTESNRNSPCLEFPGTWIVAIDGRIIGEFSYPELLDPFNTARLVAEGAYRLDQPKKIELKWKASKTDSRLYCSWFVRIRLWGKLSREGWVR